MDDLGSRVKGEWIKVFGFRAHRDREGDKTRNLTKGLGCYTYIPCMKYTYTPYVRDCEQIHPA